MIPLRDASPTRGSPAVTLLIAGLCAAAFGYELWVGASGGDAALESLYRTLGVVPATMTSAAGSAGIDPVALLPLVSHLFVHAGWLHLAGNLLYLWIFGGNVESRLGRSGYGLLFLAGGVVAAISEIAVDPTSTLPIIGASGAISAVLGAYLVLFPRARVLSLVFLGCFYQLMLVPAFLLLGLWFAIQLLEAVLSLGAAPAASGGVAVVAHVGGFILGVGAGLVVRWLRPARAASVG